MLFLTHELYVVNREVYATVCSKWDFLPLNTEYCAYTSVEHHATVMEGMEVGT